METINQVYIINAPCEEVWKALTTTEYIEGWGGGPAQMDDNIGTEFKLWNGDIWGKNTEVIPNQKLVQEWYGGKWDVPSIATFILESKAGKTILTLTHENVPDDEVEDIDEGWSEYYLGPMKEYLESNNVDTEEAG